MAIGPALRPDPSQLKGGACLGVAQCHETGRDLVVLVSPYDSKVGPMGPDHIIPVAEKRLRAGREEELLLLPRLRSAQCSAPITVPGHDGLGPRVSGAVFSATAATAGEP